jgi:O-antigen ligase
MIAFIYVVYYFINVPLWKFDVIFNNVSNFRKYVYEDFKLFIIHPSYYTSILILCIAHSLEMVLNQKKYFQLFYIICFLVISFLLLTRLNIVLQIILIIGMILNSKKLQLRYRVLFLVGILSITTTLTIYTPGIKARFVELIESYSVKPENLAYDSTNVRKAIYDCSLDISKDNLIFGVGFNNLQSQLNNCYQSNYNSNFYIETNYLTHNYYFYILLSSGIIGLGFFGFYLFNIIKISLKSDNLIFKIFILHSLIICFVEDYLYRQRGILFFNLMLMCFIKYSEKEDQNSILKK